MQNLLNLDLAVPHFPRSKTAVACTELMRFISCTQLIGIFSSYTQGTLLTMNRYSDPVEAIALHPICTEIKLFDILIQTNLYLPTNTAIVFR